MQIMEIKGVKVFAHWSVLLFGAVMLQGAASEPGRTFAVLLSYYGVILLHECGHMVAARSKGCAVWSIELYPVWGITRFTEPYSRYDYCVIAWAGVVAQFVIAIPIVVLTETFGYTRFEPLNAVLAIWGFFSMFVAVLNLVPMPPLDGAIAWGLLPVLFSHWRSRTAKREPGWRSWR